MKSVLSLALTIILLVVIILDGAAMFVAYQSSKELAQAAAQQAAIQFVSTGNETVAQQQASDYVTSRGGQLLEVSFHESESRWVETAVRAEADTYVFHFVPGLNRLIDQDSVAIIQF